MGVAPGNAVRQSVIASLMILLQNGIQIAAVGVKCPLQHARKVAKAPVRPDEAHRRPGNGAADQRVDNTRDRHLKSLSEQIKAEQHQQGDKHCGMGILHVAEGKKEHPGDDDQHQLPLQ